MWKDRCEFRKSPGNSWIFQNRIAGVYSSGAFSGFCFIASTNSSYELTFVNLSCKLKIRLEWFETWNSLGKFLEFQTANFIVFTETEKTFVVSIVHLSFIKYSIGWKNSSLLLWQQCWRLFLNTWFFYSDSVEKAKAKLPGKRCLDIDCSQLLENIARMFSCNASTVSCLELTIVDR